MGSTRANLRPFEVGDEQTHRPIGLWRWRFSRTRRASGILAEELRHFCRVVRGEKAVPIGATYHDVLQVLGWLDQLEELEENITA